MPLLAVGSTVVEGSFGGKCLIFLLPISLVTAGFDCFPSLIFRNVLILEHVPVLKSSVLYSFTIPYFISFTALSEGEGR